MGKPLHRSSRPRRRAGELRLPDFRTPCPRTRTRFSSPTSWRPGSVSSAREHWSIWTASTAHWHRAICQAPQATDFSGAWWPDQRLADDGATGGVRRWIPSPRRPRDHCGEVAFLDGPRRGRRGEGVPSPPPAATPRLCGLPHWPPGARRCRTYPSRRRRWHRMSPAWHCAPRRCGRHWRRSP